MFNVSILPSILSSINSFIVSKFSALIYTFLYYIFWKKAETLIHITFHLNASKIKKKFQGALSNIE